MKTKSQVYISGALTSVWEKVRLKVLYESIGSLCKKKGLDPFIPHQHKSLDKNPHIPVEEMYRMNMEQVDNSQLLIAYVGMPSQGTGMEIERAYLRGIDIIVLSEKDKPVSRMVKGCPGVINHVVFNDFDDAMNQLEQILNKWLEEKK